MADEPTTGDVAGLDSMGPERVKGGGLPQGLSRLRQKLGDKAKNEPRFRFYSLYGHIANKETLMTAWMQVYGRKKAPGVDGVTFEMIEKSEGGVEGFIDGLLRELTNKTYRPQAVRRVYIPKANGKLRPLGIPTIRDRVVQMATLLIIEPIFEAGFKDCSYGFRPGRSAHQALEEIRRNIRDGYCAIYDADLKGYFDSIPHDKLMACVKMRISDGQVLKLINNWLKAPIVEDGKGDGKPRRMSRPGKGTPQGGVISPLLANIYLHYFDRAFLSKTGLAHTAKARLIRYADDFVIMARYIGSFITDFVEGKIEEWLGLEINREKTRVISMKEEGATLDFLGYSFRLEEDLHGRNRKYLRMAPSEKSVIREKEKLREMTSPRHCFKPIPELIMGMNRHLESWAEYFKKGYPRTAFRQINSFVRKRLYVHLRRRSQRKYRAPEGITFYRHLQNMGLVYL